MKKHILIPYAKYQSLLQRANIPPAPEPPQSDDIQCIEPTVEGMDTDNIISVIPKQAQKKASALLQLLQDHLKWNERGEIVVDGEPIPNSHISDLIKYTVVRHFSKKQPPIGSDKYFTVLDKLNIPRSLIVNTVPPPTKPDWFSL